VLYGDLVEKVLKGNCRCLLEVLPHNLREERRKKPRKHETE